MPAGISTSDFYYILPELVLTAGALVVLIADVLLPKDRRAALSWVTLIALGATLASLAPFASTRVEIAHGLIAVDRFALFFKILFLVAAAITVLMSVRYLEVEGASPGEYYFLILCATLGMMIMAGGIDLITIFIGLETMAVSFYILAGFIKPNQRSNEAAVKYFLLGAFSLGILLYGMSLMYVLIGIVAAGAGYPRGVTATLVYLMIYSFMQLGAFAVVVLLRRRDVIGDELKDFSGLHFRAPFAAFAMLLFMLSLGGIPPTAGFMGKFWLFSAAIEAKYYWLAVIGVLNSAVSLYCYVRIVVFMYLKRETIGSEPTAAPALVTALGVAVAATLILGIYPRLLFEVADASAHSLGMAALTAAIP